MPSVLAPPTPAGTITSVGVLSFVVGGVRTTWASRTPPVLESEDEVRNVGLGIAGLGVPIDGGDRIVASVARVRGDFVEAGPARLAALAHLASTPAAVSGVTTITRQAANALLADARYVTDLWLEFQFADGGTMRAVFDRALDVAYAAAGEDRGEGTLALVFEARQVWDGVSP